MDSPIETSITFIKSDNDKILEQLKAELTCEICREPLVNAVIFGDCGHLFCEYCITNQKQCQHGHHMCPKCLTHKHSIHLKARVIDNLTQLVFGAEYREASLQKVKEEFRRSLREEIKKELEADLQRQQSQMTQHIVIPVEHYEPYQPSWYQRWISPWITANNFGLTLLTIQITLNIHSHFKKN